MTVGIVTLMATNICGFVDNLMITRLLDTRILATVGYFSPLSSVTDIGDVVILGAGILCGNYIGSGQQRKVIALFNSAFIAIAGCNVNARVVCKGGLTIRIQDDCRKFDPRERMNMFNPDSPEKNIELQMVAKLASGMDYCNNAGINTLIIKV